jgi:hypothetical protein
MRLIFPIMIWAMALAAPAQAQGQVEKYPTASAYLYEQVKNHHPADFNSQMARSPKRER